MPHVRQAVLGSGTGQDMEWLAVWSKERQDLEFRIRWNILQGLILAQH